MPLDGVQLGHYQLLDRIGHGKRSEVYRAQDTKQRYQQRQVAIKVLSLSAATSGEGDSSEQEQRQWQHRLHALGQLAHPHLVPLLDIGHALFNATPVMYLVTPFYADGSFADWLQQHYGNKPLSLQECASFVQQVSAALQYLHERQIVHQDVTPDNLLIHSTRETSALPHLLLSEAGLVQLSEGMLQGTPHFMAPEQWKGHALPASDQYALATIVYRLLTGRTPFLGTPQLLMHQHSSVLPQAPSHFNLALSPDLDLVILRALAKKAEERFPSISAFAEAFQQALSPQGTLSQARTTRKIPALDVEQFTSTGKTSTQKHAAITGQVASHPEKTGNNAIIVEGSSSPMPDQNELDLLVEGSLHTHTEQRTMEKATQAQPVAQAQNNNNAQPSIATLAPRPSTAAKRPRQKRALSVLAAVLVLAIVGVLLWPLAHQQRTSVSTTPGPTANVLVGTVSPDTASATALPAGVGTVTPGATSTSSTPSPNAMPTSTPTATSSTPTPTASVSACATPTPGSYSFEDGCTDGWVGLGTGVSDLNNTTIRAKQGTHSLKATILYTSGLANPYVAAVSAHRNLIPQAGQTVSLYVYPTIPSGSASIQVRLTVKSATNTSWSGLLVTLTPGIWNELIFTVPLTATQQITQCGVQFTTTPGKLPWTIMIDDVQWS